MGIYKPSKNEVAHKLLSLLDWLAHVPCNVSQGWQIAVIVGNQQKAMPRAELAIIQRANLWVV
jgi:hypothetical protein